MLRSEQRLRARIVELNDLKAGLAESEGKQKHLRSNVAALGGTVSALDKELRYASYRSCVKAGIVIAE